MCFLRWQQQMYPNSDILNEKIKTFKMHSRSKNPTPINSNRKGLREMKLVPIKMDYYLIQFDAFNSFGN